MCHLYEMNSFLVPLCHPQAGHLYLLFWLFLQCILVRHLVSAVSVP